MKGCTPDPWRRKGEKWLRWLPVALVICFPALVLRQSELSPWSRHRLSMLISIAKPGPNDVATTKSFPVPMDLNLSNTAKTDGLEEFPLVL